MNMNALRLWHVLLAWGTQPEVSVHPLLLSFSLAAQLKGPSLASQKGCEISAICKEPRLAVNLPDLSSDPNQSIWKMQEN